MVSCTALKLLQVVKALSIAGLVLIGSCRQIYSMESELVKEKDPMGFIDDLDCVQVSTPHVSCTVKISDEKIEPEDVTVQTLAFQLGWASAFRVSKDDYDLTKKLFDTAKKYLPRHLSWRQNYEEVDYKLSENSTVDAVTFFCCGSKTTVNFSSDNQAKSSVKNYRISRKGLKEQSKAVHAYYQNDILKIFIRSYSQLIRDGYDERRERTKSINGLPNGGTNYE
jgi:hypothetical protein